MYKNSIYTLSQVPIYTLSQVCYTIVTKLIKLHSNENTKCSSENGATISK
nr:MAG TPA: hypothetical protein [Inoviridae sp.]